MTTLVPIALYGWIFVILALFSIMPPRRAVIVAFIGAWRFLPQAAITFSGLPDLTKITATSVGALLGAVCFDMRRVLRLSPSWIDLPMLGWCLIPMISSTMNGLGAYDGTSVVLDRVLMWGVPYVMGRLYFNDLLAMRELAVGILLGGLLYVPLCLFEVRMSPQLHLLVYGFHPGKFVQSIRFGGYRPMVFMGHGLMVGLWMASASIVAVWLWRTGAVQRVRGAPMALLAPVMMITTVLCRSMGALALLVGALAVLFVNRRMKLNLIVLAAVLGAPVYMFLRANNLWDARQLVEAATMISEERAASLQLRLDNEELVVGRARQKLPFGWGGWGRWRVVDEETGRDITISDGLWIIAFGENGLAGLALYTAAVLLPVLLFLRRVHARNWHHPAVAPGAALAMLVVIYALDNLFNAMVNPIYMLAAGGLSGFYLYAPQLQRLWAAHTAAAEMWYADGASATGHPAPASPGTGVVR
jgi:hypothetical protein